MRNAATKVFIILAITATALMAQGLLDVKIVFELGGQGKKLLSGPTDAAMDREGSVYVANRGAGKVTVFGPNGQVRAEFGATEEFKLLEPTGIAVHKGKVFVTDAKTNEVHVFDTYGKHLYKFGGSGRNEGNLSSPWGILITDQERVYVAEKGPGRISVFSTDGIYLGSFADDALDSPTYMSYDPEGNIYVSDTRKLAILVFDTKGALVRSIGSSASSIPSPAGLYVSKHGWIITADSNTGRLLRLKPNGTVDGAFGSQGKGRGQFRDFGGIQMGENGQVIVTDTGNDRVSILDIDWPTSKEEIPQMKRMERVALSATIPTEAIDVAVDKGGTVYLLHEDGAKVDVYKNGKKKGVFAPLPDKMAARAKGRRIAAGRDRIYITDEKSDSIFVYDLEGNYKFSFGQRGKDPGRFRNPTGLYVTDKIFIADTSNDRVQVFSLDGVFLTEMNDPQLPLKKPIDVAVTPDEKILVADKGNQRIVIFSMDGQVQKVINPPAYEYFSGITAVSVDDEGRVVVLVAGRGGEKVLVMNMDGDLLMRFSAPGSMPGSLSSPTGMAEHQGNIYITDAGNKRLSVFVFMDIPSAPRDLKITTSEKSSKLTWKRTTESFVEGYRVYAVDSDGGMKALGDTKGDSFDIPYPLEGKQYSFAVKSVTRNGIESDPSEQIIDYGRLGRIEAENEEYEKSVEHLQKAIEEGTCDIICTYYIGHSLLALEKYAEAGAAFEKVAQVKEWSLEANLILGKVAFKQGDMIKAEEKLKIARALDAKNPDVRMYLAEVLYARRKWVEANDMTREILAAEPDNSRAYELMGLTYYKQRLYGKAEQALRKASMLNPDEPRIYQELAELYLARGDESSARLQLDKALKVDPNYIPARMALGRMAIDAKNTDEAEEHARKIVELQPDSPAGYILHGRVMLAKGDNEGAAENFRKAMTLAPKDPVPAVMLARTYMVLGQPKAAKDTLEEAQKKFPKNIEVCAMMAEIKEQEGDIAGAIAVLAEAVKVDPDRFDLRVKKGDLHYQRREFQAAALEYSEASRLDPNDMDVRFKQAEALRMAGKNTQSEEVLVESININPNDPRMHFALGSLWASSEDYERAIPELKLASYLSPDNAAYHYELGKAYLQAGEVDAAFESLRRALELDPENENIKRDLDAATQARADYRRSENVPPIEIAEMAFHPAFASLYKTYDTAPIGTVVIRNNSRETLYRIKVSFEISANQTTSFQQAPTTVVLDKLGPRKRKEVAIRAGFSEEVLALTADTPVMAVVTVEYNRRKVNQKVSKTTPFVIYSANSIKWSDPDMVGAFVTHTDLPVGEFARKAIDAAGPAPDALPESLHKAVAVYEAMGVYGIGYVEDPNRPFNLAAGEVERIDTVQFPRDTLRLKRGDCDDLSVLYSSLMENLGVRTAMALVPGHILVLVDSGLPVDESYMLTDTEEQLVFYDGAVWIPVEVTMVGQGFSESWVRGAELCNKADNEGNLDIVIVQEAWKTYGPTGLRMTDFLPDPPAAQKLARQIAAQETTIISNKIERKKAELLIAIEADPENPAPRLQLGILFAQNGKFDEAAAQFDEVLKMDPNNSDALINIGNIYYLKGEYKAALDRYLAAENLKPGDAEIKINLSLAYYRLGDVANARLKFEQAEKIDPDIGSDNAELKKLLYN